ncbi:MAG: hypothetical protein M3198_02990 [Actinomycetota bacterium]|nr:hypothetical protein [Actinomycetota bacterium]
MKRLTGRELETLTIELDTRPHRFMASAVGGMGTLAGVGLAGVREMRRTDFLRLKYPQALWFGLMITAVGTLGGAAGHYLLVRVARGPMARRAVVWGAPVGLLTALAAWALTFYKREFLSPFEPGPQVDRVLRAKLKSACLAGPATGTLVSLLVIEVLKIAFYRDEPLARNDGNASDDAGERRTCIEEEGQG